MLLLCLAVGRCQARRQLGWVELPRRPPLEGGGGLDLASCSGGWSVRVYYPAKVGPVWTYQAVVKAEGNFERSFSATLTTRRVYTRGGDGTVATLR